VTKHGCFILFASFFTIAVVKKIIKINITHTIINLYYLLYKGQNSNLYITSIKFFFLIYQINQISHKLYKPYFQIYSQSPLNPLKKQNTIHSQIYLNPSTPSLKFINSSEHAFNLYNLTIVTRQFYVNLPCNSPKSSFLIIIKSKFVTL